MEAKSADKMRCVPCCRENMLEFFATSGDFTRRLTSVKANAKFSSPLSGPEDYYSVSQRPPYPNACPSRRALYAAEPVCLLFHCMTLSLPDWLTWRPSALLCVVGAEGDCGW